MSEVRSNQRKAIEALATGHTVEQAAVVAGVTDRTVYNWKTEPAFKSTLQKISDNAIDDSVVFLSSCLMDAFKTMKHLCNNAESESTRLAAAKAIADSSLKILEQRDIVKRITEIEDRINEINKQSA